MLTWEKILAITTNGNAQPPHRVEKTDEQWRELLSEGQYYITRQSGTERPFSSDSCAVFSAGNYHCICCQTPLFSAHEKYDSGSGWPAFTEPASSDVIKYIIDQTHAMVRVEVQCNICDAHLGHVFPDGPAPTGLRFCINAIALKQLS